MKTLFITCTEIKTGKKNCFCVIKKRRIDFGRLLETIKKPTIIGLFSVQAEEIKESADPLTEAMKCDQKNTNIYEVPYISISYCTTAEEIALKAEKMGCEKARIKKGVTFVKW